MGEIFKEGKVNCRFTAGMAETGGGVREGNINAVINGIIVNFPAKFIGIITIRGVIPSGVVGVKVSGNNNFRTEGKQLIKVGGD